MSPSEKPNAFYFWLLTVTWAGWACVWVFWVRWPDVRTLAPNSVGDLASGIFSPLAFLWLLYAALAQREELKLQREELRRNNQTQELQHAAMQKQAEALNAQVRRLSAQADAEYQPVFVLDDSFPSNDGMRLSIFNMGNDVMDVSVEAPAELVSIGSQRGPQDILGVVLAHWPKGAQVDIKLVDHTLLDAPLAEFDITATRMDLTRLLYRIHFLRDENRIRVYKVSEARLDSPFSE